MITVRDLSNEILLQIFPHLPFKSNIAVRGVSRLWRQLVPLAEISPARSGLLDLYLKIIESPVFHMTRSWLLENLHPFDREAYIDALLSQHDYLPEDFRIWILEWPAKAAIACCWPGLSATYYSLEADGIERIGGCNWLGRIPPVVHTVLFRSIEDGEVDVPALLVWEEQHMTWLALSGYPTCSHAVYRLTNSEYDNRPNEEDEDEFDEGEDEFDPNGDEVGSDTEEANTGVETRLYTSWTKWLEHAFKVTESNAEDPPLTSNASMLPGPNGTTITADDVFSRQRRTDRVWADIYTTGRKV